MKLFSLLFLTLFLGKGCNSSTDPKIENAVIEYVANTRGFYQKISITHHTLSVSKDRTATEKKVVTAISDSDWDELVLLFQKVNLDQMKDLKAPTEKRFFDGAAIASLKVTYDGKTYKSAAFDHGFPPQEINDVVVKINSLVKNDNED